MTMLKLMRRLWADESGITAVEYGILAAAIASGVAVLVGDTTTSTSFLGKLQTQFDSIFS